MEHERVSTVATESSCGSQRLGLWGSVSPVSSGGEGRRCGKLLKSFENAICNRSDNRLFDIERG